MVGGRMMVRTTDGKAGLMAADVAEAPPGTTPGARVVRVLGLVILALLALLAVEVLLEAWVQELLGDRYVIPNDKLHRLGGSLPEWPKTLKNGLLLLLVAASALKISLERRWHEFRTRADLAIVVLAVVMMAAGLVNGSGPVLIAQALFVYFRGAIVFYAVRALNPSWSRFKPALWVAGVVIGISTLLALVQMVFGPAAFRGVGWVDLTWADIHRAQGLFDHPNHLGHVLGLVLIGMVAWMSGMAKVPRKWWALFTAAALGLASTQSRESMVATLVAAALIWFVRRSGGRTVLIGGAVIAVLFAGNLLVRPENVTEILFRLRGVNDAIAEPAGTENCAGYPTMQECTDAGATPSKEIRLLFYQQGARLLAHRPLLGYGVGHFGGIVAEQHDPNWDKDPRFGPNGFNLYDFTGTTVDSFWLHLAVEVGVLGTIAYLVWLYLLTAPLVRASRRAPPGAASNAGLWAVGSLVFAVLVAAMSPALEDPLFPPLLFGIVGIAWVLRHRVGSPEVEPGPMP
jgi:O-Antigen ligase